MLLNIQPHSSWLLPFFPQLLFTIDDSPVCKERSFSWGLKANDLRVCWWQVKFLSCLTPGAVWPIRVKRSEDECKDAPVIFDECVKTDQGFVTSHERLVSKLLIKVLTKIDWKLLFRCLDQDQRTVYNETEFSGV